MRIVVTGDREWTDYAYIRRVLSEYVSTAEVLIEGEARGVDSLCRHAALSLGFPPDNIMRFPANWEKFHKAAGVIRNQVMIDVGRPDLGLAFHADLENSKGTKDMVKRLLKAKIRTLLYDGKSYTPVELPRKNVFTF